MNRYFFLLIVTAFFHLSSIAQLRKGEAMFSTTNAPVHDFNVPLSTGNSGTGGNMDIVYHRVHWTVDPNTGANISGVITTRFRTLESNVLNISFDLIRSSFQNTVQATYHGVACETSFPAGGNVNVLTVTLPSIIAEANTLDSVTISYSGIPVPDGLGGGFVRNTYTDQSGQAQNYITTLSESYEDRNWWPCKADMQDKIDSMDIYVNVPWTGTDTFWVASNGTLADSVISNGTRTFHYKTRYPIASYLVFLSAAKFNRYYSNIPLGATNVPVYWYLLGGKSAGYYSNAVNAMQKMNPLVQAFSSKFGDYPFKNEKHGYYDGLTGADGMEHQTFSGIYSGSLTSMITLDHELAHQWFGDNVTFGTWNDLWLAEGFARYGEILAAELVPSLGYTPYVIRAARKNAALNLANTTLWIPDASIASSSTIWNSGYGSAVYERGCMVVSMLRAMSGDERFFGALKNYQTVLKGRSASGDSLKRFFNDQLGVDISEFFRDYVGGSGNGATAVGGRGNPVYEIKWSSPAANNLVIGVQSQSKTSNSNVSYFNGPVVVRATGDLPGQDTTIVFYDWGNGALSRAGNGIAQPANGNALTYQLSFTPTDMQYDDSARTLSTGTMVNDDSFKGYTWYGTASSDWYNAANWSSCCGVPPSGADVTIATVTNAPILNSPVNVHNLTINDGKFISIAAGTLTIGGEVMGNGLIGGSLFANLIITGKAGTLRFVQGGSDEGGLQSLVVQPGASAVIGNDIDVLQVSVHPAALLTVQSGAHLTTH